MFSLRTITFTGPKAASLKLLLAGALVATACTSSPQDTGDSADVLGTTQLPEEILVEPTTTTAAPATTTTTAPPADVSELPQPGAGITVNMARANWSTGRMQAAIYQALLGELGYDVPDPTEVSPADFYPALAIGTFDFWANSWPLGHDPFFELEVEPGVTVADNATYVGEEMLAGGLQGFLIDIPTAQKWDIRALDDIATRPELAAVFDTNGNGIPDIAGCDPGWGCAGIIDNLIIDNGWEGKLEQIQGSHRALFEEQLARFNVNKPVLSYVWTPGSFVTELVPSEDVFWLGVRNPAENQTVPAPLPDDQCRLQPCTMGFSPSDIVVSANKEFMAANPPAAKLFELVKIRVLDVNLQTVKMAAGEDSEEDIKRHAADWMETNRALVNEWLIEAAAAS